MNDGCDVALYTTNPLDSLRPQSSTTKVMEITDNKSAIDSIHSTTQVTDRSLCVEIARLREFEEHSEVAFHHVPGKYQIADVSSSIECEQEPLSGQA